MGNWEEIQRFPLEFFPFELGVRVGGLNHWDNVLLEEKLADYGWLHQMDFNIERVDAVILEAVAVEARRTFRFWNNYFYFVFKLNNLLRFAPQNAIPIFSLECELSEIVEPIVRLSFYKPLI